MTNYPDIFAALAAPFEAREVKKLEVKPKPGGRPFKPFTLDYITARTAMNRLDEVLGPEHWSDEYFEGREGLKCRLTITMPDGKTVSKEDGGAAAGMDDHDSDEKSAFSSCFKRAASKWGVGRYLYKDGVPRFATGTAVAATNSHNNGHTKVKDAWGGPGDRKPAALPPAPKAPTNKPAPTDTPQALFYSQLTHLQSSHRNGRGLVAHLGEWARGQGLPRLVQDWPELRLAEAQEVARSYLQGATADVN